MEKGLASLFVSLNDNCNYLILRGWEYLLEKDYSGIHGDIDILCDNMKRAREVLGAKKIHAGSCRSNYIVDCGEKMVQFDIRYVGDNYYCREWEKAMLLGRTFRDFFYVLDDENYFYSLIYHILIHKEEINKKYFETLLSLSDNKPGFLFESGVLFTLLKKWMNDNGYNFVIPKDYAVKVNWELMSEVFGKPFLIEKQRANLLRKKDILLEMFLNIKR